MLHKEKNDKRRKEINIPMNNFQNRGRNNDFYSSVEKTEKKSQKIIHFGTEFANIIIT